MPEEETFLNFVNVKKRFGKRKVLDGINLQIRPGERFGIIGLSGAGKTTLLNILIGFYKPDYGKVFFKFTDIGMNQSSIKTRFGFGTQEGSFYENLTVRENLLYFGQLYGLSKSKTESRSKELLKFIELEYAADTLGGNLSKGMKRRLDIACAMINKPEVLILDEPTEDLDPHLRNEILLLIRKINEDGTTVVITSHLLADMELICTRLAILHKGKIMVSGTPDELRQLYTKSEEIKLELTPPQYKDISKHLSARKFQVKNISKKGDTLTIFTESAQNTLKGVIDYVNRNKKVHIVNLEVNRPTLQEIFKALTLKDVPDGGSATDSFAAGDEAEGPSRWQRFREYLKQVKHALVPPPSVRGGQEDDFFASKIRKGGSELRLEPRPKEKEPLSDAELEMKMKEAKALER